MEEDTSLISTIYLNQDNEDDYFKPLKIDNVLEDMFFKEILKRDLLQISEIDYQHLNNQSSVKKEYPIQKNYPEESKNDDLDRQETIDSLGKKKYSCSYDNCFKEYKSIENLHLHILNFHKKIKPYECKFCFSKFSHRNGKIYHERKMHTLDLPYSCNYNSSCSMKFPSKSSMIAHIKSAHLHIKRNKKQKVES